jgi:hypothetical protein
MSHVATLPIVGGEVTDLTCVQCGYDLRGLSPTGVCPECGTAVERSLQGTLLRFSSPDYVANLYRGLWLIVTGILVQVALVAVTIFVAFSLTPTGASVASGLMVLVSIAEFGVAAMILWGWWLFSEPDPRYTGRDDGSTARKIVRIAVIVVAVTAIAEVFKTILVGAGTPSPVVALLLGALGLLGLIAWVTQFFAAMQYLRWLAPRLPDAYTAKRARLLMWLTPLLYTVGLLLLGLGPLIALVLYWNLLDHVRKRIKAIRAEQSPVGA